MCHTKRPGRGKIIVVEPIIDQFLRENQDNTVGKWTEGFLTPISSKVNINQNTRSFGRSKEPIQVEFLTSTFNQSSRLIFRGWISTWLPRKLTGFHLMRSVTYVDHTRGRVWCRWTTNTMTFLCV